MESQRTYLLRADELKRLRERKGLDIRQLANRCDVDYKTVRRWLNGGPAYLNNVAVLAVGTMVLPAFEVAEQLAAEGIDASVVNCRFIKPMDEETLAWVSAQHDVIITIEEGTAVNGFGAAVAARVELPVEIMGVPDVVIQHANRDQQLAQVGLDKASIAERIRASARRGQFASVRETA